VSVIEEPDVRNLQVRFCEGHGLSHKGINMMNERKGESHMSTRHKKELSERDIISQYIILAIESSGGL